MGDIFERGQPLTRRGLFQLVTDEVYRDGVVDDTELEVVWSLAHYLNLEREVAQSIAAHSRHKFQTGLLKGNRPLEPRSLYRNVLEYILSDGEIDPVELEMLHRLRELMGIDDDEHAAMMAELGG